MNRSRRSARRGAFALALLAAALVAVAPASGTPAKSITPLAVYRAPSTNTFYLLAAAPCATGSCLRLYRSHDDNESTVDPAPTFTRVSLPPVRALARTPMGTLMNLVFATPTIGYALEGTSEPVALYVTMNGATTWQRVTTPPDVTIYGLTATGGHLYALFVNCEQHVGTRCREIEMVHSTLDARNWSGVSMAFVPPDGGDAAGSVSAYGENVFLSEQPGATAVLFTSHDGGKSFTRAFEPKLGSIDGCDLTAVGFRRVWAQCPTGMQSSFFYSADAGSSWNLLVHQPYFNTSGGFFATAGTDFAYLDLGDVKKNIVRVNIDAQREHVVGELHCASVQSAVFMSVFHGYAVCDESATTIDLMRTTNGGASWNAVSLPMG